MQPVQETAVHILANFQLLMMIFWKQINHILNNEDKSLKIHYSFDLDKIDKIFRFHQKVILLFYFPTLYISLSLYFWGPHIC